MLEDLTPDNPNKLTWSEWYTPESTSGTIWYFWPISAETDDDTMKSSIEFEEFPPHIKKVISIWYEDGPSITISDSDLEDDYFSIIKEVSISAYTIDGTKETMVSYAIVDNNTNARKVEHCYIPGWVFDMREVIDMILTKGIDETMRWILSRADSEVGL